MSRNAPEFWHMPTRISALKGKKRPLNILIEGVRCASCGAERKPREMTLSMALDILCLDEKLCAKTRKNPPDPAPTRRVIRRVRGVPNVP